MMESAVEKMDAQLKTWSTTIDDLAAKILMSGAHAGFDAVMNIDELKALHAIAHSKLDELRAAGATSQASLTADMKSAWDDLERAFKNPRFRRRR